MQERVAKAPGEQAVGRDLIANYGARPGKVTIERRAQRFPGGGKIADLDVPAGCRDHRRTAH
jgi:hypothetical protein